MIGYFLRNKTISWMITLLLSVGGVVSFLGLGQLEFPDFTIRMALVSTAYPGATPQQVEEEVTLRLEKAIQEIPNLKRVSTVNSAGLSQITVELDTDVQGTALPQYWDLLRRKIGDTQASLPPGAGQSLVVDDFSDVYGLLLNLSGDDYSLYDLKNQADFLQRELRLVDGVKKVVIAGDRPEQVTISLNRERMQALNIPPDALIALLNAQNAVADAGSVRRDGKIISLQPSGEFKSVQALEDLIIGRPDANPVHLGDIATVTRGLTDQPGQLYHADGKPAISIGLSFVSGVNVVKVGEAVDARLAELESRLPLGMELTPVYHQPEVVKEAVSGFVINLMESVGIVIVVLLIFMGVRSGLLMGLILTITILGTLMLMAAHGLQLQKVSLGALIIALGMLVDNAIVVTEGMLIGLGKGKSKLAAAKEVAGQNWLPLLGATAIAITAFAPIGLSPDATGELVGSLFWVLFYSLLLSWVTALTLTPFFFDMFFKDAPADAEQTDSDPYKGLIFVIFGWLVDKGIRFRWLTIATCIGLLVGAFALSSNIKNAFFPDSTTPLFFVDVWMPEGSDILESERIASQLEAQVAKMDEVVHVTSVIGGGAQRFTLTYSPEDRYASYSQLIVETDDLNSRAQRMADIITLLRDEYPQVQYKVQALQVGPSAKASLEARIYGPDPDTLRTLATQVSDVFRADPLVDSIRLSWGNRVEELTPDFLEQQARRVGVTRQALHQALLIHNDGQVAGVYREGSDLIPIVLRDEASQRYGLNDLSSLNVWSAEQQKYVSAGSVMGPLQTRLHDPLIKRRDRQRMLAVYAEPLPLSGETAANILARLQPKIEAIPLPEGYHLGWGGEDETSRDAKEALFKLLPLGILGMFILTMLLFGNLRQSLAIWSIVPLTVIGIVGGLLAFNAPFTFMALLGTLSLVGMVLKNAIVLVEEIKIQMGEHDAPFDAIMAAAISRVRPVSMAAITTMLGMIPLFGDAFFASMAVVIVFGLGAATLLTLVILPVIYATLFGIYPNTPARTPATQ